MNLSILLPFLAPRLVFYRDKAPIKNDDDTDDEDDDDDEGEDEQNEQETSSNKK